MGDKPNIPAAVSSHIKALRILGREEVPVGRIAAGLGIDDEMIRKVFRDWIIPGAALIKTKNCSGDPCVCVIKLKKMRFVP